MERPANIHTVLVVSPDNDRRESSDDTEKQWWEKIGDAGWVLDPTFLQYSFETAVQPIFEYLWTRVWAHDATGQTTSALNSVDGFGSSFHHDLELNRDSDSDLTAVALVNEVWIRAMDNALYHQIEDLGGRDVFLNSSHEDFGRSQDLLERAVISAVREARDSVDAVLFLREATIIDSLRWLVSTSWGCGHGTMMNALQK